MELALADYSVQDTVESVRASLRSLAEDKGLEFVATVPDGHSAGPRRRRAHRAMPDESRRQRDQVHASGRVEIGVELRGDSSSIAWRTRESGSPPTRSTGSSTEFRQGDATITSEFGGTGLGLSITRKFVELHKGRIWVESELGRGSTFFIAVPLRLDGGMTA